MLLPVEGGDGIQANVVMSTLNSVAVSELVSDSTRVKRRSELAALPLARAEQGRNSQAASDRLPEEEIVPDVAAIVRESPVSPSSGDHYYKGSELTQRPQPIESIELSYPALGLLQDIERSGSIVLRLLIAETGVVDQVLVESSNLPAAFQDETVVRFTQARFAPGQIDGVQVKSQMRIEVTFSSGA